LGDLSENAEYADAKEAQAFNEGRIAEIAGLLKNIQVVSANAKGLIGMGSKVTAETNGQTKVFTVVSFNEADPLTGKISNESPLGIAINNKKAGDTVNFQTPKGESQYKILKVE
jgi:transcription elongation factor GreA